MKINFHPENTNLSSPYKTKSVFQNAWLAISPEGH